MSAIAGLIHWDGRGADRATVERMTALLTPYGRDAQNYALLGNAALIRTLGRITPEDSLDQQPLQDAGGEMHLVFDGRLDNRDELAQALGLSAAQARSMADSQLAQHACLRWDTEAPARLLGDFALACWRPAAQRLWLARSALGLRLLVWHGQPGFFAFATLPKALFAVPGVTRALCEESLADYLTLMPAAGPETLFKDVFRVLPGHIVIVDRGRSSARCFHRFDPERELILRSDEEYVEAFREQLQRAVLRRLRSAGPIGAHLSSGFDSATVTTLAARQLAQSQQRLVAYTAVPRLGFAGAVPRGRHGDEGPGACAVAARHANIDHVLIRSGTATPLDRLRVDIENSDGAIFNPCNRMWIDAIHQDAARRGVKVLLSGQRGNMTISHTGVQLLPTLLRSGRWLDWWQEARAIRRRHPDRTWSGIAAQSFGQFVPAFFWVMLTKHLRRQPYEFTDSTPIHPEFRARMNCAERARAQGRDSSRRPSANSRLMRITGLQQADPGAYCAGANAAGLEVRDPTSDLQVVEFCLSIPEHLYLRQGQDRWLLRRVMQDALPPEITNTQTKGLQTADWYESVAAALPRIREELDRMMAQGEAGKYLDLQSLKDSLDRWPSSRWNSAEVTRTYRRRLLLGLSVGTFIRYVEEANV